MKETYTTRSGYVVTVENGFETYIDERGINTLKSYRGKESSVTVPEGIQVISCEAFAYSSIEQIVLPEGLLQIDARAFSNCQRLKGIIIPESTVYIMSEAFENCINLTSVMLPKEFGGISRNAFRRTGIETAVFPSGIKRTFGPVYVECNQLTTAIIMEPEMVLDVGEFSKCDKLETVYYDGPLGNLPPSVKNKIKKTKTVRLKKTSEL